MSPHHTTQFLNRFAWGLALVVAAVFVLRVVGGLA